MFNHPYRKRVKVKANKSLYRVDSAGKKELIVKNHNPRKILITITMRPGDKLLTRKY